MKKKFTIKIESDDIKPIDPLWEERMKASKKSKPFLDERKEKIKKLGRKKVSEEE